MFYLKFENKSRMQYVLYMFCISYVMGHLITSSMWILTGFKEKMDKVAPLLRTQNLHTTG